MPMPRHTGFADTVSDDKIRLRNDDPLRIVESINPELIQAAANVGLSDG